MYSQCSKLWRCVEIKMVELGNFILIAVYDVTVFFSNLKLWQSSVQNYLADTVEHMHSGGIGLESLVFIWLCKTWFHSKVLTYSLLLLSLDIFQHSGCSLTNNLIIIFQIALNKNVQYWCVNNRFFFFPALRGFYHHFCRAN